MNERSKIIIAGIVITGLGTLITPVYANKLLTILNMIAFVGFVGAGIADTSQRKGISIEDFDKSIERQIAESKREEKYGKMVMYSSVRPMLMIGIVFLVIYSLSFLFFMP